MDPIIANASGLVLACVFAPVALHKWWQAGEFDAIVADYSIVPAPACALLARTLPVLEFSVALGFLVPPLATAAAVLAAMLILVYSAAIMFSLARGRRMSDCGCGGPMQSLSAWLLLRNSGLLILAVAAAAGRAGRQLDWLDWGVTLLAAITGSLCYYIFNQMLANLDRLKLLRSGHA